MKLPWKLRNLSHDLGGGNRTINDRIKIMTRVCIYMKSINVRITSAEEFKTKHIQSYVKHRLQNSINKRTIQNEMAVIRQILRAGGRIKLADSALISNVALEIDNVDRTPKRKPISDEHYHKVLAKALQKDRGLAAALQLSRMLGLTPEEAVSCSKSLKTWLKELEKGSTHLLVSYGTRGGGVRRTRVLDHQALKWAVSFAIKVAEQRKGKLIDKPGLKEAMEYWRSQTVSLGLTGENSPYSLRFAWTFDAIKYYQQQGYSEQEAILLTSLDLGHKDGRGIFVKKLISSVRHRHEI